MKLFALALAVICAALLAGCGDSAPETTTDPLETVTVEQVTDSFSEWRYNKASKVSTYEISVSVSDIHCIIDEPGTASCYDTVTVSNGYTEQSQSLAWSVTYDEEGNLVSAINRDGGGNAPGSSY